ncbi:MAG: hypothetical protein R3338_14390 [Thermoanaerobaculia bacterium]|nr:hypothetical protein [Thermoanaerobaculia bacterium]
MTGVGHLFLMVLYAAGTAGFFALLWRESPRDRVIFFVVMFLGLVGGGILIARLLQAV